MKVQAAPASGAGVLDESAHAYELALARRTAAVAGSAPRPLAKPAARAKAAVRAKPGKFLRPNAPVRVQLLASLNDSQLQLGARRAPERAGQGIDIDDVSDFLRLSAGIKSRKLGMHWNVDGSQAAAHSRITFARGAASGGGLYPVSLRIASFRTRGLEPGVYHYDVARHSLDRLQLGDYREAMRTVIELPALEKWDAVLVLTARFWSSAFKYGHFAYKVIMQDVGALLGQMEQVAYSLGWQASIVHWFADEALSRLLRLDASEEAPFALMGIAAPSASLSFEPGSAERGRAGVGVGARSREPPAAGRSESLRRIHGSTLVAGARPDCSSWAVQPSLSAGHWKNHIGGNLASVVHRRETHWGQIRLQPALSAQTIRSVLSFCSGGVRYVTDLYGDATALPLIRVVALIRTAADLPGGLYEYDPRNGGLTSRSEPLPADIDRLFLRKSHCYDQVPIVLILVGDLRNALERLGNRGIRVLNAEAGIYAQRAYLACAALSLGCGAVLGFDAARIGALLQIDPAQAVPLLSIVLGSRAPAAFAYDFRLY